MLLSNRPQRLNGAALRALARGLALVALMGISACGFRPLYGTHQEATLASNDQLALIHIAQIPDRIGQQLRNDLLSRLNPNGEPSDPKYIFNVSLSESIASLGVKKTSVVTRGNLTISASYNLIDLSQAKGNLSSGTIRAISSYDIPQAQFTALAAVKDARARAIREIADDLKIRLAVYFRQAEN